MLNFTDENDASQADLEAIAEDAPDNIFKLARECLEDSEFHREQAIQLFLNRMRTKPHLLEPLLKSAARYFIRQAEAAVRSRLTVRAAPKFDDASGLDVPPIKAFQDILHRYILKNGVQLGMAAREDIEDTIEKRKRQIQSESEDINFLTAILSGLRRGAKVAECFTEEQVDKLHKSFCHER